MRKFLIILLSILALSGCSLKHTPHDFPHTLIIDARFPANEQADIAWAVNQWSEATGNIVNVQLQVRWIARYRPVSSGYTPNHHVFDSSAAEYCMTNAGKIKGDQLGCGSTHDLVVDAKTISARKWPWSLDETIKRVALHELGHHWGLEHIKNRPSIMQPKIEDGPKTPCITQADLEQFCSLYDCSGHNVHSTCGR